MAVIGIESSAHTLGIGIVDEGRVLANVRRMYKITNTGIIPVKVSDFHERGLKRTLVEALRTARIGIEDIDAIGFTKGPGIGPCLRVGQLAAGALSLGYGIPLYAVNHGVAHIEIAKHLGKMVDPLAVYVSGGNSQILGLVDEPFRHYKVFGETFDIGVGNMLDSFAREAGLNPAWGSTVARVAEGGRYIGMPYTVKGMDFTFTGLLTHAVRLLSDRPLRDVAFSIQETAFSMICEATERALLLSGKRGLVLSGGVAQSKRLSEMMEKVTASHDVGFFIAPDEFNADNGAMIALVAEKMANAGMRSVRGPGEINQKYRVDAAAIGWDQ
jgi:N6-L-threonylcarbamoyladenine synthase